MWKAVVASAVLIAASGSVFAQFTPLPQESEVATRFGSLTVDTDKTLLFNGRKPVSS